MTEKNKPGRPVDGYLHKIVKLAFENEWEYWQFIKLTTTRSRVEIVLKEVMKNDKRSDILSTDNKPRSN